MRVRVATLTVLLAFFVVIPTVAQAASIPFFGPIIEQKTWQTCPLGWGALIEVMNNIIKLLLTLLIVFVAPIMIAYAGFILVANPFNPGAKEKAKSMLMNLVIGLVVALIAYSLIALLMATIAKEGSVASNWATIITSGSLTGCLSTTTTPPPGGTTTPPPPGGVTTVPPSTGTAACPTCVLLTYPLTCKAPTSCMVASALADKLKVLAADYRYWRVTEAYPPTVTHTAACHNNGTCIDAGLTVAYTATNATLFYQAASRAGLRAVLETDDCALRDAAKARGVTAFCKTDTGFSHITGNHFSVYNQ